MKKRLEVNRQKIPSFLGKLLAKTDEAKRKEHYRAEAPPWNSTGAKKIKNLKVADWIIAKTDKKKRRHNHKEKAQPRTSLETSKQGAGRALLGRGQAPREEGQVKAKSGDEEE